MSIDIDESKVHRGEFGLWLGWTLATAAGMLVGMLPFVPFLDVLPLWLARILIPLVAGFLVGIFQWLVLSRYMTHTADWVLNGGAGFALGYALGMIMILQTPVPSFFRVFAGYLFFGLIIGLIQWPVLRREIPNPLPWVITSIAGWALGAFLSQMLLGIISGGEPVSQALSTAILAGGTGLIAGAVTGLVLVYIVRQPDRPEAG